MSCPTRIEMESTNLGTNFHVEGWFVLLNLSYRS